MDSKVTGKFIADKRKEKKLTQNDLANLLQVTDKAISRWETGEGYPEISMLPKLATLLGCSVDDILQGGQKEIKSVDTRLIRSKFQFYSALSISLFLFGYLINLILIYTTEEKYWSLFAIVVFGFSAYVLYYFQRFQYLTVCEYNEEDKMMIYNSTKRLIVVSLLTIFALLPQYTTRMIANIFNEFYLSDMQYLRFDSYLVFAFVYMAISAIPLYTIFAIYQKVRFHQDPFEKLSFLRYFYKLSTLMFIFLFFSLIVFQYRLEYELLDRFLYLIPIVMIVPYVYPLFRGEKKILIPLLLSIITIPGIYLAARQHHEIVNDYNWVIVGEYFWLNTMGFAGPGLMLAIILSMYLLYKEIKRNNTYSYLFYGYKNILFTSLYLFFFFLWITNKHNGYQVEILSFLFIFTWYLSDVYLKNRQQISNSST